VDDFFAPGSSRGHGHAIKYSLPYKTRPANHAQEHRDGCALKNRLLYICPRRTHARAAFSGRVVKAHLQG